MNSTNGKINFGVGLDNSQLRQDAAESKRILQELSQTSEKEGQSMEQAMKNVGKTVAGVFAIDKLKDFAVQVATVRGEFQQLEIAFTTMLQSKSKADALMSQLIKTAATTPFNMSDVANSAKQLLAYGLEADKVNETLIRLGDIAAGLSLPINDLAYLYGTTMVQGRMYTQDLNQFLGRGIPLAEELAKQFDTNVAGVKALVQEGKIGFPEVEKAIISMTSEGSKFGGLMEEQSKTITGQISNIEDAIEQMFNELGKKSEGAIAGLLSGVSTLVEHWETIGKVLMVVISTYGAYKAAVIAINAAQKIQNTLQAMNINLLRNAVFQKKAAAAAGITLSNAEAIAAAKTVTLSAALQGLKVAIMTNPITFLAGAIGLVASAMFMFGGSTDSATAEMEQFGEAAANQLNDINSLLTIIKHTSDESNVHGKAIDDLKKIYEEYGITLDETIDLKQQLIEKSEELTDAVKREGEEVVRANIIQSFNNDIKTAQGELTTALQNAFKNADIGHGDAYGAFVSTQSDAYKNVSNQMTAIANALIEDQYDSILEAYNKGGMEWVDKLNDLKGQLYKAGKESFGIEGSDIFDGMSLDIDEALRKFLSETQDLYAAREFYQDRSIDKIGQETEALTYEDMTLQQVFENGFQVKSKLDEIGNSTETPTIDASSIDNAQSALDIFLSGLNHLLGTTWKVPDFSLSDIPILGPLIGKFQEWSANNQRQGVQNQWEAEMKTALQTRKGVADQLKKVNDELQKATSGSDYEKWLLQQQRRLMTQQQRFNKMSQIGSGSGSGKNNAAEQAERERQQLADQASERIKAIGEYERRVEQARKQAELDIRQATLNAQEDSYQNELALIQLNYDRLIAENERRQQEMIEALAKNKLNEWLLANPKATRSEQNDYLATLLDPKLGTALTTDDLTDEQRKTLQEYADLAALIKEQAEKKLYERLLKEYRDYEARRTETNRKFDEDRRAIESMPIDQTEKDKAIEELERKRTEAIRNINNEESAALQKTSSLFVDLFADAADKSDKELRKIIKSTKELLSYLNSTPEADITANFGFTAEQLKSLKASPEQIKAITEQLQKLIDLANKKNPFRSLSDAIKNLFKDPEEGGKKKSLEAKLKDVGEAASECADMIGGIAGKLSDMFEAAGNDGMSEAFSAVEGVMNGISNIANGFAQGGLIGGIASVVGEGINLLTSAFQASARHAEALKKIQQEITEQQRAYNIAILEESLAMKEASTVFGNIDYMKASNSVNVMKQSYADLSKELANLSDIQIKTGHKKTGLFGWGKGKDLYSSLLEVYPQLIDSQGNFNRELAESILNSREFKGEGKEALQYMIDLYDEAEAAYQEMKDYLTGIFGDLGNTMSDALVDAFKNGTDAAEGFADSVEEMLENLGKQMIFSSLFGTLIQQANDEMLGVMTNQSLTEEQKFNQYIAILDSMTSGILGQQDNFNNLMKAYQDMAAEKGISLWESDGQREASQKGIAQASQDSVDELNGRATAIQGHTYSISENTKILTQTTTKILESVINIDHNTKDIPERLRSVEESLSAVKSSVSDIAIKGVKLRS